jgi:S-adenosylmethionine hydrolase
MVVTLLTDFGTADYFVGAMKGAVLAADPRAQVVDITHEIPAFDVEGAAFTLASAFESFPAGTVHVAVVDPGVGSARRPLAVEALGHFFVGPDNGLFTQVYARARRYRVFHLTNEEYFRRNVSTTFHGRDIFAPAAGALSRGVRPEELGPQIDDEMRLPHAAPRRLPDGTLEASIIHVDRFGNCVTNLRPEDLPEGIATLTVNGREIKTFRRFYAEGAADDDNDDAKPFAIWGSAGLLELALNRAAAADALGARRGQKVYIK